MPSDNNPIVQVEALTKHHGDTLAVDGLSFDVRNNEFFSILGPSGSGKTTTLRLIAGLLQPDEGDIFVNGQSMKGLPPNRRPVNTVFQDYALFPHMTVWDNVAFGLRMQGVAGAEVVERVGSVLDIVQLPNKGGRLPSELSGGEQQRVALARALVNRPAVILLDEPLGALDQQLRQDMQRELKYIQAQVGGTFICVTHHQAEALFMSDRVAVLNEGRLMQIGKPEDLYAQPSSLFVAEFVGRSNRLEGEVILTHDSHSLFQSYDLPSMRIPHTSRTLAGRKSVMILRPEQLTLSRKNECGFGENCLESQIDQAFYLGEAMQYVITVAPHVSWTVQGPVHDDRAARFRPGEKAFVRWGVQHGLLFPQ
ncbi:ABC transporter ATP-binding protein [Candidatus Nitronereus thalassa]|uniref:ABC transporter ATP-binding protein n=1 Tax=Candidatus Nitronereus thalassa TaxID=3020898 RepID=A0ABU3K5A9_9BACT|nr:ABC transporter ATP-binding protein [Candidatus Nitronereus thalassa]MDT7041609.1 ABC transporter ATP-binding protein [Candidatus Nitronereus thalassa]